MLIREFKEGVEALSRFTNQRSVEPAPFLFQIGVDDRLSLVAGNERGTLAWRLDSWYKGDLGRFREGVPSKTLVQAAKMLKGKDSIHFKVHMTELEIFTSPSQGKIALKYVDQPELIRPAKEEPYAVMKVDDMTELVDGISAATSFFYDTAQFQEGMVLSTDRYKLFQMFFRSGSVPERVGTQAGFWKALRGATGDGELRFYNSGVRVLFNNFEAFTPVSKPWDFINYVERAFPAYAQPAAYTYVERKTLLGLLKGVKDKVQIERLAEGTFFHHGDTTVELSEVSPLKRQAGFGTALMSMHGPYLQEVLSAIDSKNVVIAYSGTPEYPYLIRGEDKHSVFLIAPIVKK